MWRNFILKSSKSVFSCVYTGSQLCRVKTSLTWCVYSVIQSIMQAKNFNLYRFVSAAYSLFHFNLPSIYKWTHYTGHTYALTVPEVLVFPGWLLKENFYQRVPVFGADLKCLRPLWQPQEVGLKEPTAPLLICGQMEWEHLGTINRCWFRIHSPK